MDIMFPLFQQKEQLELKKYKERFKDRDIQNALSFADRSQRLESLDREYREVEAQYNQVLQRLASLWFVDTVLIVVQLLLWSEGATVELVAHLF